MNMTKNKYKFGSLNNKVNVTPVTGPTHDEGGIEINPNTEIQGGESQFEGFVFSNDLVFKDDMPNSKSKKKLKNLTFAEKALKIQKKYGDDQSPEAKKTKGLELAKLAKQQEELKASMIPKAEEGMPQEGEPRKMFLGGMIAAGLGDAVNIGRGLFEKPRKMEPIKLGRATANTVDLGEQRASAALNSNRGRQIGNATTRNNANSVGQLMGNTLYNNARTSDDLNRVQAESFANEDNINAQILNQTDQFNTQISNNEIMTNKQIQMQNNANEDAKRELLFQGIGGSLQALGNYSDDLVKSDQDLTFLGAAFPDADPKMIQSLNYRDKNFWQKLGFRGKK